MKKTIYLAVITLITIGCVIYGVNNRNGNRVGITWSAGTDSSKYDIEESTVLEPFDSITVDGAVMDLVIKKGSEYALDYKGTKSLQLSYGLDNGKLVITQKKKGDILNTNNAFLTLTVPAEVQLERADIGIDVGNIDMSNLKVNVLEADIDVGNIEAADSAFDELIIDSDTGDVDLNNCSFTRLKIENDVGDVEIDSSKDISEYTYDLKTDVGEVEVGAEEYGRKYKKDGKDGEIVVRGDVGDITVN